MQTSSNVGDNLMYSSLLLTSDISATLTAPCLAGRLWKDFIYFWQISTLAREKAKEGKTLWPVLLICFKGNCLKVLFPSNIKTSTRTVRLLGKGRCMTADMIIKVFPSLLHTRRFEELLLRLRNHWTAPGVARCPPLQGPALETSAGVRSTSSPREKQRWAGIRNTAVRAATKPLLSQLAAC